MAKLVKNERLYYEQVVQSSRNQLMLYPYHLAEAVVAGLRVTPFQYYSAALLDIMDQEKSYDALPNFTAVDCVRLLGIGRNQYIELMNQRKSGRARLFMRKPVREITDDWQLIGNVIMQLIGFDWNCYYTVDCVVDRKYYFSVDWVIDWMLLCS